MKFQTLIAVVALAASGAVLAQTPAPDATPRIDARAANQQKRIDQGVASGSLTAKEAAHAEARQSRLDTSIAKAKADGVVTQKERVALTRKENRDSKKIFNKKHNAKIAG